MTTLTYMSYPEDVYKGNIDNDTDTFYVMLVLAAYTADQAAHTKRSDITNESSGTGYTAGGQATAVTVTKNTGAKTITVTFGAVSWAGSSITARGAVYYKRRGGAATADELVGYDDFGSDKTSVGAAFNLAASTFTLTVNV